MLCVLLPPQATNGKHSKIYFKVESDTGQLAGEVYAVEPQIDASTRTLKIRATAPNTRGKMLPGQFVTIHRCPLLVPS